MGLSRSDGEDYTEELRIIEGIVLSRFIAYYPTCFTNDSKLYNRKGACEVNRVSMFAVSRIINRLIKEMREDLSPSMKTNSIDNLFDIIMSNKFHRDVCSHIFDNIRV